MDDPLTRRVVIWTFTGVVALIVLSAGLHFIRALSDGGIPVPEYVVGQFWIFIVLVLGVAGPWIREALASKPRRETQQKIDATHREVTRLRDEVHNGIQEQIAEKTANAVIKKQEDNGHDLSNT